MKEEREGWRKEGMGEKNGVEAADEGAERTGMREKRKGWMEWKG